MLEICFSHTAKEILRLAELTVGEIALFLLQANVGDISDITDMSKRKWVYEECFFRLADCADVKGSYESLVRQAALYDEVRIWYSRCPDEYCGMLYLAWLMKDQGKKIFAIDCSREIFDPKAGISRVFSNLGQSEGYLAGAFITAQEEFTKAQIIDYAAQWEALKNTNAPLRIYQNGEIITGDLDYYDDEILNHIPYLPVTAGIPIGDFIFGSDDYVPYYFIRSRIKYLIDRKFILVDQYEDPLIRSVIRRNGELV